MSTHNSGDASLVYDYVQRLDEISAELAQRASVAADRKRGISASKGDKKTAVKRNRQAQRFYDYAKKKRQEQQTEAYDEYATILAYLMDEGYATSINDAMTIVENMSDEWIISILNECD